MRHDFAACSLREGMFLREEGGITCSLPGSAVSVRFTGREIRVFLRDVSKTGKIWFNAWIDDLPARVFRVDPENETDEYVIAEDLCESEHTLILQKRTEAGFGTVRLDGFSVPEGKVLPPPQPRKHHILLIGDSITCGYGNEAQIPSDVDASRENFAATYGFQAARSVGADVLACAASGTGVYQNYAGGKEGRMSDFYMDHFSRDLKEGAMDPFTPDAIVINLGTNDWSAPIREEDYTARYTQMLDFIRRQYPLATLICAIGSMNLGPSPALSALVKKRKEAGDGNLHFLEFPLLDVQKDGFGGAGHPSLQKHREMSVLLSQMLRKVCSAFA